MLSLSSAKHDSHLHKTKHSEPIHDSTGVKEMGNVGRQLHAINTSLHLVKRKTVTDTDISSKQSIKSLPHHDESGLSRTHQEQHHPQMQEMTQAGMLHLLFACAVLILATLLGVIAYMLLFSKLTTSTESCETKPCSDLAARLLDSMDTGLDPCNDFYSFVCAHAHVRSVRDDMNAIATQGQFAELSRDLWRVHKPSRLYHRCLEPEPSERAANILALKAILRNLSLHWPEDQQHPSDRHPMDVMLEMAIKWDINFLFSLEVADSQATGKVLVFRKPRIVAAWVDRLEYTAGSIEYARHVQTHLTVLNASSSVKYSTLMKLERSFTQVLLGASNQQSWMTLSKFDSIAASLGKNALLKYIRTNYENELEHSWSSEDWAVLEDSNLPTSIGSLFEKHTHEHLLIGIAWLFIQSHLWALIGQPALMFREDIEEKKKRACLEYVDSRLGLLSSAEYETQLFPSHDTRHDVSNFLLSVTNEFKSLAKNASWMDRESRETVQLKIDSVTLNVMPAEEFFQSQQRESMYEIFPPMNGSVFFDDWLRASRVFQSLQGHDHFRDVYSKRRTSLGPEPFSYNYLLNLVDAAMVALEPPIYYVGAPFAINYAGLGSLFAREVARSFDSRGTTVDNRGENVHWWGSAQSIDYNHRVSCDLGQNTTIAFMPAIPALEASYSAYQTAVYHAAARIGARKDIKIRRLESYSEDQIFFMTYCYSLCDRKRAATRREECNVPLSHFSEFAKAFRCIRGAPMNALKKCKFF
ncbi:neprilysin-1-like [Rhipicephalus microplus]|uniref:neprilysin-1-like n=1 Tax=Rhipicephalus microplus TaxID=6941 RepID=UPI003F6A72FD